MRETLIHELRKKVSYHGSSDPCWRGYLAHSKDYVKQRGLRKMGVSILPLYSRVSQSLQICYYLKHESAVVLFLPVSLN